MKHADLTEGDKVRSNGETVTVTDIYGIEIDCQREDGSIFTTTASALMPVE